MRKLQLKRETVAILAGHQLRFARGGVITVNESDVCGSARCTHFDPWGCPPPDPTDGSCGMSCMTCAENSNCGCTHD